MTDKFRPIAEILVPMDFSECSINALHFAIRLAAGCNARIHILSVDDDPLLMAPTTDQSYRDEHEAKMAAKFIDVIPPDQRERFHLITAIRMGTAYHEIDTYAAENSIDMIVMGIHGRSAFTDALLGSVSSHVLRSAPCPVVTVRRANQE